MSIGHPWVPTEIAARHGYLLAYQLPLATPFAGERVVRDGTYVRGMLKNGRRDGRSWTRRGDRHLRRRAARPGGRPRVVEALPRLPHPRPAVRRGRLVPRPAPGGAGQAADRQPRAVPRVRRRLPGRARRDRRRGALHRSRRSRRRSPSASARCEADHLERQPARQRARRAGGGAGRARARRGGAPGGDGAIVAAVARGAARRSACPTRRARSRCRSRAPADQPPSRRRRASPHASSRSSGVVAVPWPETTLAARVEGVVVHAAHVPNAANGWIKPDTLAALRAGLEPCRRRGSCAATSTRRAARSPTAR